MFGVSWGSRSAPPLDGSATIPVTTCLWTYPSFLSDPWPRCPGRRLRGADCPQVTFHRRSHVMGDEKEERGELWNQRWVPGPLPPGLTGLRFLLLPKAGTPPVSSGSSKSPNRMGRASPLLPGGLAPGGRGTQGPLGPGKQELPASPCSAPLLAALGDTGFHSMLGVQRSQS